MPQASTSAEPVPAAEVEVEVELGELRVIVRGYPFESPDGWGFELDVELRNESTTAPAQLGPEPRVYVTGKRGYGSRQRESWSAACLSFEDFEPAKLLHIEPGQRERIGVDLGDAAVRPGEWLRGTLRSCGVRSPTQDWMRLALVDIELAVDRDGNLARFTLAPAL